MGEVNAWSQTAIDFDMELKIQFISLNIFSSSVIHHLLLFQHRIIHTFCIRTFCPIRCLKSMTTFITWIDIEWKSDRKKQLRVTKHNFESVRWLCAPGFSWKLLYLPVSMWNEKQNRTVAKVHDVISINNCVGCEQLFVFHAYFVRCLQ